MGNKHWSQKEIEFLEDNNGLISNEELCKKLGRSLNSIETYRCRHNIGRYDNHYTFVSLGIELGKSRESIRRYANKGMLICKRLEFVKFHSPAVISINSIKKFIKNYWWLLDESKIINNEFKEYFKKFAKGEVGKVKFLCKKCKHYHWNGSRRFEYHKKYCLRSV